MLTLKIEGSCGMDLRAWEWLPSRHASRNWNLPTTWISLEEEPELQRKTQPAENRVSLCLDLWPTVLYDHKLVLFEATMFVVILYSALENEYNRHLSYINEYNSFKFTQQKKLIHLIWNILCLEEIYLKQNAAEILNI